MSTQDALPEEPAAPRRSFLVKFWAIAIGGVVSLFPILAGIPILLDPLRRARGGSTKQFIRVATLDAVPDDGVPRQFPVVKDATDAWTFSPDERIGAVYLRRLPGEQLPQALNVVCPHAGCFIGYDGTDQVYKCPCHTSSFELDGKVVRPTPSPRDMDPLTVRVSDDGDVEVEFVNYYPGKHERIERT